MAELHVANRGPRDSRLIIAAGAGGLLLLLLVVHYFRKKNAANNAQASTPYQQFGVQGGLSGEQIASTLQGGPQTAGYDNFVSTIEKDLAQLFEQQQQTQQVNAQSSMGDFSAQFNSIQSEIAALQGAQDGAFGGGSLGQHAMTGSLAPSSPGLTPLTLSKGPSSVNPQIVGTGALTAPQAQGGPLYPVYNVLGQTSTGQQTYTVQGSNAGTGAPVPASQRIAGERYDAYGRVID
jgi:hypothetical protein